MNFLAIFERFYSYEETLVEKPQASRLLNDFPISRFCMNIAQNVSKLPIFTSKMIKNVLLKFEFPLIH